ncbi:MAG: CvpA family protein [Prevotellaceae bacterium]|jgi:membrane protein required for colicin V production|nr:CvpA family protein [Prevotellaceae bacterium]
MEAFSIFDIIVLISLFLAAVFGYIRGMVCQLIGLIGIIAGTYVACKLALMFTDWWRKYFNVDEGSTKIIVFIIMFAIIALTVYFITFRLSKILDKLLKSAMLNWINRLLGMIFGILKTVVIFSILAYAIHSLKLTGVDILNKDLKKSATYGKLVYAADFVFPYMVKLSQNAKPVKKDLNTYFETAIPSNFVHKKNFFFKFCNLK